MKSYRSKVKECVDNGNCIRKTANQKIATLHNGILTIGEILWCVKNDCQCMSSTCREERFQQNEKNNLL